jgi:Helix-turn-helix domain
MSAWSNADRKPERTRTVAGQELIYGSKRGISRNRQRLRRSRFLTAKTILAKKLNDVIDSRHLTWSDAAELLEMLQIKVSAIRNYKFRGVSLDLARARRAIARRFGAAGIPPPPAGRDAPAGRPGQEVDQGAAIGPKVWQTAALMAPPYLKRPAPATENCDGFRLLNRAALDAARKAA